MQYVAPNDMRVRKQTLMQHTVRTSFLLFRSEGLHDLTYKITLLMMETLPNNEIFTICTKGQIICYSNYNIKHVTLIAALTGM